MIKNLQPYCEGCHNLKPVSSYIYADYEIVNVMVSCEHAKICNHAFNEAKNMIKKVKEKKDE